MAQDKWTLLHLTDLHLGAKSNQVDHRAPKGSGVTVFDNFQTWLPYLQKREIHLAAITGDLIEGTNEPEDAKRRFGQFSKEVGGPLKACVRYPERVHVVPGNHDVRWGHPTWNPAKFTDFKEAVANLGFRRCAIPITPEKPSKPGDFEGSPCVVDEDRQLLILSINSAIRCGELMEEDRKEKSQAPIQLKEAIEWLRSDVNARNQRELDGIRNKLFEAETFCTNILEDINKATVEDKGQVTQGQIDHLRDCLEKEQEKGPKERWDGLFKVALLHHHLVSVPSMPRDHRPYERMIDEADVMHTLAAFGFHLVLTGHKHHAAVTRHIDPKTGHGMVVATGPTLGGTQSGPGGRGFSLIEAQRVKDGSIELDFIHLPVDSGATEARNHRDEYLSNNKKRYTAGLWAGPPEEKTIAPHAPTIRAAVLSIPLDFSSNTEQRQLIENAIRKQLESQSDTTRIEVFGVGEFQAILPAIDTPIEAPVIKAFKLAMAIVNGIADSEANLGVTALVDKGQVEMRLVNGVNRPWGWQAARGLKFARMAGARRLMLSEEACQAFSTAPETRLLNVAQTVAKAAGRPAPDELTLLPVTLWDLEKNSMNVKQVQLTDGWIGDPREPRRLVELEYRDNENNQPFIDRLVGARRATVLALTHQRTAEILRKALDARVELAQGQTTAMSPEEIVKARHKHFWEELVIVFPSPTALEQVKDAGSFEDLRRNWFAGRRSVFNFCSRVAPRQKDRWRLFESPIPLPFVGQLYESGRIDKPDGEVRVAQIVPYADQKDIPFTVIHQDIRPFKAYKEFFEFFKKSQKNGSMGSKTVSEFTEWELQCGSWDEEAGTLAVEGLLDARDRNSSNTEKSLHPVVLVSLHRHRDFLLQKRSEKNASDNFGKFANITGWVQAEDLLRHLTGNPTAAFSPRDTSAVRNEFHVALNNPDKAEPAAATKEFDFGRTLGKEDLIETCRYAACRELLEELTLELKDPDDLKFSRFHRYETPKFELLFCVFSLDVTPFNEMKDIMDSSDLKAFTVDEYRRQWDDAVNRNEPPPFAGFLGSKAGREFFPPFWESLLNR
jgi:3',5'-cyclic AMP phosphodiesterase CpdA